MKNCYEEPSDEYFLSQKNLNALKEKAKFVNKQEEITLQNKEEVISNKVNKKVERVKKIVYNKCEKTDLNKFFTLKLKDFFPITGF